MGALGNRKVLKQILWAILSYWLGFRKAKERIDELFSSLITEQDYINTLLDSELGEIKAMMRGVSINSASGLGMTTGFTGPMLNITTACEAGIAAMSVAQNLILLGEADVVITGGMWTRLNPISLFGLLAWRSIISPGTTSDCVRPFDTSRNGMIPAEGGAMFVFEEKEHALRRGAKILAEVAGLGAATAPQCTVEPHKATFVAAMRQALANAGIKPHDLGFIIAHATGTVEGDAVEAQALSEGLQDAATSIPVTGLKAGGGHPVLGASARDILVLVRTAIERGLAPPNPTLTERDPKLPPLFLPVKATPLDPAKQHFAAQSAGFVGMHRVAILRRPSD
jgi:3-oxoacyl-(acyl-carrier-protein) synthase